MRADAVVVLFSGTLGSKQGLQLVPGVAQRLAEQLPQVHFVVCGDGPMRPELERRCAALSNVRLLALQPTERLGELLGLADIHLLTQDPAAEDLVLPSKLNGMLASGRPVVATCAPGTELARVVTGRGLVVPPGDADALADAIAALATNADHRRELGISARAFAEEHLSRDRVLQRWAAGLQLADGRQAAA
jgi:colanic acid biosynthesis glycosyl transferase WcaI